MKRRSPRSGELKALVQEHANLYPSDSLAAEAQRVLTAIQDGTDLKTSAASVVQTMYGLRKEGGAKKRAPAPTKTRARKPRKTNGTGHALGASGVPTTWADLRAQLVTIETQITASLREALERIDAITAEADARRARMDALRQQLAEEGMV